MFQTVPLSIIRRFSLYTQQWYMSYHCCVYSEKLLMMDRGTVWKCRVLFQNKFEKLVHLVGFIIRIMTDLLNYVSVSSCMWMVNALWQTLQQMMVFGIPYVLCGIHQMGNGAFTLMQNLVIMEQVLQMEHSSQVYIINK